MTLTGYAGVLLANTAAASLTGWRRGLFLPVALPAARSWPCCASVQLAADGRWSELCLLLVLTAVPTVLVAARRQHDRPVALPVAICCLAGAALLALPDGLLGPVAAALVLTVLYGVAMTVGAGLDPDPRRATARAAALCALAAVVLLRAEGERTTLAAVLAVQGAFTLGWAWRTRRDPVPGDGRGRRPHDGDGVARRRGPARAGVLGGRGRRRPGRRRVVHPAGRGRAADRRRPDGWSTAPPGPRGGRACWSRPCRRVCWPSSPRTARGRSACWSARRW